MGDVWYLYQAIGAGFGYSGAQLNTDGTNLFVKGSPGTGYNGSAWTCDSVDTVCTLATDHVHFGPDVTVMQAISGVSSF